jgi:hypothetical protein
MKVNVSLPLSLPIQTQVSGAEKVAQPFGLAGILPGFGAEQLEEFKHDSLIAPEHFVPASVSRLVVILPEAEFDRNRLAHKIWLLASAASLPILFLAFSRDRESAAYQQRRLVTIATVTAFGDVKTSTYLLTGRRWLPSLQRLLKPKDLLICLSQDQVIIRLFAQRPLGAYLAAILHAPVYIIGDLPLDRSSSRVALLWQTVAWLASLVVVIAFAVFQIWIDHTSDGPTSTILLCVSIIVEFVLILITNT